MGLNELLNEIRQEFLNAFHAAIEEKELLPGSSLILEPALRQEDDTRAIEGELQLPIRTDIAVLQDDTLTEMMNVDSDCMLGFDPVEFEWTDNLHVDLGPFAWQGLSFRVRGATKYDWEPLQDWFWRWFRDEEEDPADPLLGAIHFLSDPGVVGDAIEFHLDMGSAPIEAFEEMLDAVAAAGATHCEIGETDYEEEPEGIA